MRLSSLNLNLQLESIGKIVIIVVDVLLFFEALSVAKRAVTIGNYTHISHC